MHSNFDCNNYACQGDNVTPACCSTSPRQSAYGHYSAQMPETAACTQGLAGCCGCRNEGKSAQEVSQQLKEPGASWLDRTTRTLAQAVLHDATLESWQELYRAVPSLDWGAGAPVAVAASKQVSVYFMQPFHHHHQLLYTCPHWCFRWHCCLGCQ